MGKTIKVSDAMQRNYSYVLEAEMGAEFAVGFEPFHTPSDMLALGVFEGKYLNDCRDEYPADWFDMAKLSDKPDPSLNCFGVKSRQPLSVWREKGWIHEPDPRGWFQWYCRYFTGRRLPKIDAIQIKRWRAFSRHAGQVRANCMAGNVFCRPRQRQALLQWAYDPLI